MNEHKAQKATLSKINSKSCAFCIIQTIELWRRKSPVENTPNIKNNPENQATHAQLNGGNATVSHSCGCVMLTWP